MTKILKKLPILLTDEDADKFLEEENLADYDLSGFKPVKFVFANKIPKTDQPESSKKSA